VLVGLGRLGVLLQAWLMLQGKLLLRWTKSTLWSISAPQYLATLLITGLRQKMSTDMQQNRSLLRLLLLLLLLMMCMRSSHSHTTLVALLVHLFNFFDTMRRSWLQRLMMRMSE
jgi:hypothetical protein